MQLVQVLYKLTSRYTFTYRVTSVIYNITVTLNQIYQKTY